MTACDLLVTGASGFVGRHLVTAARGRGLDVVELDADLRDAGAVRQQVAARPPAAVAHLASPRREAGGSWEVVAGEIAMAGTLFSALQETVPDAAVLVVGSAAQYGMALPRPVGETDPTRPLTVYGTSKCVLEEVCTAKAFAAGLRVIFARSFNHVGPGQQTFAPVAQWARQAVAAERAGGGSMAVGDLDVVRDFLDVRDVAAAYIALLERGEPGVVNVCSGVPTRLGDLVTLVRELLDAPLDLEPDPALAREDDPPYVVGDPARLTELTGWRPQIELEQSVRDVLDEWRERAAATTGAER
jgi:GDP-4-dehydro-6-deoxy-D-mannose reductase